MDKEKLQKEIVDAISQIAKNEARKNSKITIVKGEITGVDPLNCYYNFSYDNHLYSARSVLGGYSVGQKVFIAFSGEQENNIILCGEIIGGGTVAGSEEKVLSSIVQQYYISNSSKIEPPQNPGEDAQYQWSDTKLTPTEEAPYLWTRYKYVYTDASIIYTTPYVLNFTEAINESNETITDYIDNSVSDIQSQIDKKADIWFYDGMPSLNTYPANEWTTDEIKDIHVGDLYFDTSETSGKAYEFKKDQSAYSWQLVQDQDVIKALNDAARAQDTADNKRRVFYSTPIPPYDKGDLWVQGSNGDILYCNTPKASGATYNRSDWVIASKYTDDSNLNIFKEEYTHYKEDNDRKWENTLGKITTIEGQVEENTSSIQQTAEELSSSVSSITTTIGSLQDQIDGAIETYYLNGVPTLSNEPAVSWEDNETKDTHIGDLYYDKDTGYAYRFMKDGSTYTWVKIADEDISKAFAEAEKANKAAEKAQGDVNNLTEVVNENTTNIQQNSEQITINAQETTKIRNDLSSNYYTKEEANAAIKTSADNISLSVEKTYTKKEDVEKNVISMVEQFYLSDSPTELSGGSWSSSSPQWENGKYIWRRTYVTYFDQTSGYTPSEKGVCITGNDGKNGASGETGVGIESITNYYLATSANSGITVDSSGWTEEVQTITVTKKYLWNYEKTVYTDQSIILTEPCVIGVYGETGQPGRDGADGTDGTSVTITSTVTDYQKSTSGTTPPTGTWSTSIPTVPAGQYLWTRVRVTYSDDTDITSYSVARQGQNGANGAAGEDGVGISSIQEYYQVSSSSTTEPSSWVTTPPVMTAAKKYLWNYEKITYTNSTTKETAKRVIGVYGDKGQTGATGNGISTVQNYYLASSSSSGITASTSGWTTTIQSVSNSKKYLWNYEKITYTNGSSDSTDPCIIGVYGDKGNTGVGVKNSEVTYQASSSGTSIPTGSWVTSIPTVSAGQYLWTRTVINYTDGKDTTSYSVGKMGNTGATGSAGKGIKSTSVTYQASTSGTTVPTGTWNTTIPSVAEGQYLWTRTIITYTDNSTTPSYSVGKMGETGPKGATGATGNGISSITEHYQVSTSNSAAPSTWTTTVPTLTATNKYLWNYETITYTNGTSKNTSKRVIGVYGDKGQTGSTGATGNGIKTIENYYLASTASSGVTVSTSGWTTTVQSVSASKKYLWNYEKVIYTNGSSISTDPCIIGAYGDKGATGATGPAGEDGKGAANGTQLTSQDLNNYKTEALCGYYFAGGGNTVKNKPAKIDAFGMWVLRVASGYYQQELHSANTSQNKVYIRTWQSSSWTSWVEKGKDGATGPQGPQGATGATGNGISSITEYYQVSTSNSTAPTSWSTTVPTLTSTKKYLWNYEKITYTNGSSVETKKRVIGVYGDKGQTGSTGATGNGIKSITNYYLASANSTGITTSTSGWTTTVQSISASKKYLWNYEKVIYTNGSTDSTDPCVIGAYGDKGQTGATGATGNGISSITEYYQVSTSNSTAPSSWLTTVPTLTATKKYLWNYEHIAYTNGTSSDGKKRVIGVYGDKGATGSTGATGTGISSITVEFYLSTSKTTQTGGSWTTTQPTWTTGKYLWTRQKIVYKNPASTVYTTPQCDSSWEAVNEVEVGGRNLLRNTAYRGSGGYSERGTVYTISVDESDEGLYNGKSSLKIVGTAAASSGSQDVWQHLWDNHMEDERDVFLSFYAKGSIATRMWYRVGGASTVPGCSNINSSLASDITTSWKHYVVALGTSNAGDPDNTSSTEVIYGFGAAGTFWINSMKLEYGTKATDWTPAPEDTQEGIDNAQDAANNAQNTANDNKVNIEANSSKIDILDKSIQSLVVHKDASGEYQSSMIQDETGWHFDITSITNDISKSLTGLNSAAQAIENNSNAIEGVQSDIDDIAAKTAYITITQTEDGNPYMELGASSNDFKLGISNTSIDFMDSSTVVAYVSNQQLYIGRATVKNEFKIGEGGGFVFKKRANGNMGIRWEDD